MPPISGPHSEAHNYLIRWVGEWVEHFELGVVRSDPFQMKTSPTLPGRAPDLIFVARRNLKRLHSTHLEGAADVAIEILSPGTKTIDRVDKFREYESGGVKGYWLIDPVSHSAEFYKLSREGRYQLMQQDEKGVFRSTALRGFWIEVEWLWHPPTLREIRGRWGIA